MVGLEEMKGLEWDVWEEEGWGIEMKKYGKVREMGWRGRERVMGGKWGGYEGKG